MDDALLRRIHEKGYWRVVIRPTVFDPNRLPSLSACKETIEESCVRLRGWDYPHIEKIRSGDGWIDSRCDWDGFHLEYWRFYTSGQFVHHFTCIEEFHRLSRIPAPSHYLLVLNVLYTVTEIFQFARQLAQRQVLTPAGTVIIRLHGMKERELTFQDAARAAGFGPHRSGLNQIPYEVTAVQDELATRSDELAIDAASAIFESFGWFRPPVGLLGSEQWRFLQRRLGE